MALRGRFMIIGIDAHNIRSGGGLVHLIELVSRSKPKKHKFKKIVVFSSQKTLDSLPNFFWIEKVAVEISEYSIVARIRYADQLDRLLFTFQCDHLLVLGGVYLGGFPSLTVIQQNLLPFSKDQLKTYFGTFFGLKLWLLRLLYSFTMRKAQNIIFLTNYSKSLVAKHLGVINANQFVIYHGVSDNFRMQRRRLRSVQDGSVDKPFRLVYVSTISLYKHQLEVIQAAVNLRRAHGWNLRIDLVGSVGHRLREQLTQYIEFAALNMIPVCYHGILSRQELRNLLNNSDAALWMSNCEAFGMGLTEYMVCGLPVIAADHGSTRELMGNNFGYCDPKDVESIAESISAVITDVQIMEQLVRDNLRRSVRFDWEMAVSGTLQVCTEGSLEGCHRYETSDIKA